MSNPVTILFVISSMEGGGAQRVISRIIQRLDREKFIPVLALVRVHGPFLKEIPKDVKIIDLNSTKARYALIKLIKVVRAIKPQIVFSILGYINLLIVLVRIFFPRSPVLIARETDIPSYSIPKSKYPRLMMILYRWLYPFIDYIVCQCDQMKLDLIENFSISAKKLVIINNPVDLESVQNLRKEPISCYQKDTFNLVTVGRLSYQKGYDLLVQAVSLVKNIRVFLAIIGEGKNRPTLKKQIDRLGLSSTVNLVGFQDNPYPWMEQADLMVISSRFEPFPNVVLEANACGTPVLAFDCPGGLSEIIEPGLNGWLVENGNIAAFASKIDHLADTMNVSRKAISDYIRTKYDIKEIVKQYEALFSSSLNKFGQRTKESNRILENI